MTIQTRKDFFIAVLDQFAHTGNQLIEVLDAIESGECECFIEDWLHTLIHTNNRTQIMTTEQNILFENARTGYELLQVLEDIMNDQSNIQTPTLVPMEF